MTDETIRKRIDGLMTEFAGSSEPSYSIFLFRTIYREALNHAAKIAENRAGELTSAQCDGCGNYDDVAYAAANDEARDIAEEIRQAAKEI